MSATVGPPSSGKPTPKTAVTSSAPVSYGSPPPAAPPPTLTSPTSLSSAPSMATSASASPSASAAATTPSPVTRPKDRDRDRDRDPFGLGRIGLGGGFPPYPGLGDDEDDDDDDDWRAAGAAFHRGAAAAAAAKKARAAVAATSGAGPAQQALDGLDTAFLRAGGAGGADSKRSPAAPPAGGFAAAWMDSLARQEAATKVAGGESKEIKESKARTGAASSAAAAAGSMSSKYTSGAGSGSGSGPGAGTGATFRDLVNCRLPGVTAITHLDARSYVDSRDRIRPRRKGGKKESGESGPDKDSSEGDGAYRGTGGGNMTGIPAPSEWPKVWSCTIHGPTRAATTQSEAESSTTPPPPPPIPSPISRSTQTIRFEVSCDESGNLDFVAVPGAVSSLLSSLAVSAAAPPSPTPVHASSSTPPAPTSTSATAPSSTSTSLSSSLSAASSSSSSTKPASSVTGPSSTMTSTTTSVTAASESDPRSRYSTMYTTPFCVTEIQRQDWKHTQFLPCTTDQPHSSRPFEIGVHVLRWDPHDDARSLRPDLTASDRSTGAIILRHVIGQLIGERLRPPTSSSTGRFESVVEVSMNDIEHRLVSAHVLPHYAFGCFNGRSYAIAPQLEALNLYSSLCFDYPYYQFLFAPCLTTDPLEKAWMVRRGTRLMYQFSCAVAFLHSLRIQHNDLKPENACIARFAPSDKLEKKGRRSTEEVVVKGREDSLVEGNGRWKRVHQRVKQLRLAKTDEEQVLVIDFESCTQSCLPPRLPDRTGSLYTAAYVAPERAGSSHGVSFAGDVWSLGVSCLETLGYVRLKTIQGKDKALRFQWAFGMRASTEYLCLYGLHDLKSLVDDDDAAEAWEAKARYAAGDPKHRARAGPCVTLLDYGSLRASLESSQSTSSDSRTKVEESTSHVDNQTLPVREWTTMHHLTWALPHLPHVLLRCYGVQGAALFCDLINACLLLEPERRITAAQFVRHPFWSQTHYCGSDDLPSILPLSDASLTWGSHRLPRVDPRPVTSLTSSHLVYRHADLSIRLTTPLLDVAKSSPTITTTTLTIAELREQWGLTGEGAKIDIPDAMVWTAFEILAHTPVRQRLLPLDIVAALWCVVLAQMVHRTAVTHLLQHVLDVSSSAVPEPVKLMIRLRAERLRTAFAYAIPMWYASHTIALP